MKIREFKFPEDHPGAYALWQGMEAGVHAGRSDTLEEVRKKLERDPDLFLVAEVDGDLVGTVIGGFDGRRGMIYHLAVRRDLRDRGIGGALLAEVEKRLQARGCLKCYLLVSADNDGVLDFYRKKDWRLMDDHIFAKEFYE